MVKQLSRVKTIARGPRQGSVDRDRNKGTAVNPDELLTGKEVEAILKVGRNWCAKDRIGPARIRYVKLGRAVRYRLPDVVEFINTSTRRSTSDTGSAGA